MHLSGIHVYPIKSCRGLSLESWPVDRFGFQFDRRWMLIDERDVFLSQRTHRRLALVRITMGDEHFTVETEGRPAIQVSRASLLAEARRSSWLKVLVRLAERFSLTSG